MKDLERHQRIQKEEERERFGDMEDVEMNGNGLHATSGTNGANGHDEFDYGVDEDEMMALDGS